MANKRLGASVSIFVAGVAVAAWALTSRVSSFQEDPAQPAYTAVFQVLTPAENGDMKLSSIRIRHQMSDGGWRTDKLSLDPETGKLAHRNTFISSPDRGGTFRVGTGDLHYIGSASSRGRTVTKDQLVNSDQFVGEDEVAGLKTYVLQNTQPGLEGTTYHVAPELGIVPIKIESPHRIQELVAFFMGEPAKQICTLPDLPVATDAYQDMIEGSPRKTGKILENALDRFQAKESSRRDSK